MNVIPAPEPESRKGIQGIKVEGDRMFSWITAFAKMTNWLRV